MSNAREDSAVHSGDECAGNGRGAPAAVAASRLWRTGDEGTVRCLLDALVPILVWQRTCSGGCGTRNLFAINRVDTTRILVVRSK